MGTRGIGENLALQPQGNGWERAMVEYPNVIEENGKLRLFYCGQRLRSDWHWHRAGGTAGLTETMAMPLRPLLMIGRERSAEEISRAAAANESGGAIQ